MNTIEKIANTKATILTMQERNFNALLSLCESEIEKLFLINILYYVFSWENILISSSFRLQTLALYPYKESQPGIFKFDEESNDYKALKELERKGVIVTHEYDHMHYYEVIGFSFKERDMANDGKIVLKIFPQYKCLIKGSGAEYRLDFAIFSFKMEKDRVIQEYKICVECDGHEYHKSKDHRTKDNIRDRALQGDGWRILRYTGTEIFATDNTQNRANLLNELIELSVMDHFK